MKHILFDLDGTLLNTGLGILKSVQYALKTVGVEIEDLSILERHIGPPILEGFQSFYDFDYETASLAVSRFREMYMEIGLKETSVYDGIQECLDKLTREGKKLYVATSKPEVVAKQFLEHFGLDRYFVDICGSTLDGTRTTKSEVIEYLMSKNDLKLEDELLMVGDREHDVLGAADHGIKCVGVLYGFGSREEFEEAGAAAVVKTPDELVTYILCDKI